MLSVNKLNSQLNGMVWNARARICVCVCVLRIHIVTKNHEQTKQKTLVCTVGTSAIYHVQYVTYIRYWSIVFVSTTIQQYYCLSLLSYTTHDSQQITARFNLLTFSLSQQQYSTVHHTISQGRQQATQNSPCDSRSLQTRARSQVAEVGLLLVLLAHGHLLEHLAAQPRFLAGLALGDVERLREGGEVRADSVLLQASVLARTPAGRGWWRVAGGGWWCE